MVGKVRITPRRVWLGLALATMSVLLVYDFVDLWHASNRLEAAKESLAGIPSPTLMRSPAPTELPVLPDDMDEKSRGGAWMFTDRFYSTVSYGLEYADWEPVEELASSNCAQCRDFWSAHPSRLEGEPEISFEIVSAVLRGNRAELTVNVAVSAAEVGRHGWMDEVELIHKNGHWRVESITVHPATR